MKTKFSRATRRSVSVVLSVLMMLSCLTMGLTSTTAAEITASDVSATAQDDGTVAAAAEDDGTVAASTDSGTVAATDTSDSVGSSNYKLLYGKNDSATGLEDSELSVTVSNNIYTVTIPTSWSGFSGVTSYQNYFFALSSTTSYSNTFWQNEEISAKRSGSPTGVGNCWSQSNGIYRMAGISIKPDSLAGDITLTVDGTARSYTFSGSEKTASAYTVSITEPTNGTLSTTTQQSITYGEEFSVTATPATGYKLSGWTLANDTDSTSASGGSILSGGLMLYISGNTAYVKATGYDGGTAILTATFEEDSSYTPPTTGDNIYTATLDDSITENSDLYTGVKATFYDYFYDSEATSYNGQAAKNTNWLSDNKLNTAANSTGDTSGNYPYNYLNTAISNYSTGKNITYPLYFGEFYNFYADTSLGTPKFDGTNEATSWLINVNNSNPLTNHFTSVTGLASSTLGTGGEIYHATSSGTNDAEMEIFNADWLTNGETNGTGYSLGAVVTSDFPVRKTKKSYESNKIYVNTNNCSWYEDSINSNDCVILAKFWNSSDENNTKYWVQMKKDSSYSDKNKLWVATIPDNCNMLSIERAENGATWGESNKTYNEISKKDISWCANTEHDYRVLHVNTNGTGFENDATKISDVSGHSNGTSTTTYYEFSSNGAKDNVWFTKDSSDSNNLVLNYGTGTNYGVKGIGTSRSGSYEYSWGYFPFDNDRGYSGSTDGARNFGFGTKFDIDFTIGTNGQIDGVDQIFEYSGDDDLWVYIDGELVLDLGGDHKMSTGSINFATGVVTADFAETASGGTSTQTTLQSALGSDYNKNPNTVHTLTIYYLERGMNESNLKIGFNFEPVGNEFDVTNTVDTTQVNSGLVSAVESAINSSSSFTYDITPASDTASYAYTDSKTTNGSDTGTKPSVNGTSANVVYVDQFTKGASMTVTQNGESGYAFTTTNSVNDIETGESISTTGGSATGTGTFTFLTTKENPGDLDVTHLSADYVNEVQVGSLTVGKEITNYGDADTEFTLCLEIKLPDTTNYEKYSGVTYVKSNGTTGTLGDDGTFKLKCYETATFYGIPLNSYVKVYEKNSDSVNTLYAFDDYVASDGLSNKADVSSDDNNDNKIEYYEKYGVSAELTGSTNTLTIENRRRTYRVEYLVPTRLYGQAGTNYWTVGSSGDMNYENCKVYAYAGYVDDSTNFTYVEYNGTYGVNFSSDGKTDLIVNMLPYEDVFDQTITWNENNIGQYLYNAGNTKGTGSETKYDVVASWVPSIGEFARYVNAVVSVNDTTLNFFGDSATDSCNKQCTYGTLLASTDKSTMTGLKDTSGATISSELITSCKITEAVGEYTTDNTAYFITAPAEDSNGNSFLYWKVEKMDDSGANTSKEVTRCYTRRFAYTMYDNYYITAEYGDESDSNSQSSYGSASAYIIDITRSQWNDTVNHADDENQSYSSASTSYDRVYIDFELAYNYQGIQLNEYTGDDTISVGFVIYASNGNSAKLWTKVATQNINLSELDNKNRIEYYYGLKNTSAKAGYKYAIVPYISVDGYVVNYGNLNKTGNMDFDLTSCDGYTTVFDTFGGTNSPFANICNAAAGTMPAYSNETTEENKIANDPTIKDKADSASN